MNKTVETIIKIVATWIIGQWVAGIVLAFIQPSGILIYIIYFAVILFIGGLIFGVIKLGGSGNSSGGDYRPPNSSSLPPEKPDWQQVGEEKNRKQADDYTSQRPDH